MNLVAPVRLLPTPEQAALLRDTLERCNAACDWLADLAANRGRPNIHVATCKVAGAGRVGGSVPIDLQSDCHDSYPSKNNGLQLTWPGSGQLGQPVTANDPTSTDKYA